MIVTTKLDDTDFSKCLPTIDKVTTLRLPGGTQSMKTYSKIEDVPESQLPSNRHFIIDDLKLQEMASYVNEHGLDIIWVWNINDTFENQLKIVQKVNLLTPKLKAIEFSNETYLRKFALGHLNKNGVSKTYLVEDYVYDLKKFFVSREACVDINTIPVIVCGASYDSSSSPIMDYRRAWNVKVKAALNDIFEANIPSWVHTAYHIYISPAKQNNGDEEISFTNLSLDFLNDITTPVITEMGSYYGVDDPKTKDFFDNVFKAIGSWDRFGFHVFYSKSNPLTYQKKYGLDHHPFALYGRNGITKFGNFMQKWVKDLLDLLQSETSTEPEVTEPEVTKPEVTEPVKPVEPELQEGGLEEIKYTEIGRIKQHILLFYYASPSPEDILELVIIQKGRITRKRYKSLDENIRFVAKISRRKPLLIKLTSDDLGKTIEELKL